MPASKGRRTSKSRRNDHIHPPGSQPVVSLISTFEATDLVAGAVTRNHPGCAVRIYIADEVLDDGLDMHYEILGGDLEAREEIQQESRRLFGAEFKVTQDRPDVWRANGCFHDLTVLRAHPVFGRLLDLRKEADRVLMVFEAGLCILRLDFACGDDDPRVAKWKSAFLGGIEALGREGTVRAALLDRSLEDWAPLA